MRYTYELYDHNGVRIDVTTRVEEIFQEVAKRKLFSFIVNVTDNASGKEVYKTDSLNKLEEWYEQVCMIAQWQDADARAANREKIRENGCPVCKHPWDPFNEDETGIHVKGERHAEQTLQEHGLAHILTTPTPDSWKTAAKLPDANLKTAAAVGKPQMSGIPPIAIMALGMAMQDGVNKYSLFNWRGTGVTASVFYDAMLRHLLAWYSGEDCAPDSKVVHLAHLMAGAAIILDAEYNKCLNDDRVKGVPVTTESLTFIKK